jgi:hypothetical protein
VATAPRQQPSKAGPVLPTPKTSQVLRPSASRGRPETTGPSGALPGGAAQGKGSGGTGDEPLRPIGADRLRALREAIENGTYPSEADVLGGLNRLLESPDAPEE